MTIQANVIQGIMSIKYKDAGWSEKFFLDGSSYDVAKATLLLIVERRVILLPTDAQIVFARVNFAGNPREAKAAVTSPMAGTSDTITTPPDDFPNQPDDAIHYRLETPGGQWANRHLRCIPDSVVEAADLAVVVTPTAPGGSIQAAGAGTTWEAEAGAYLAFIRDTTIYAKPVVNETSGLTEYDVTPWDEVAVRGVSSHKTGRPFGQRPGRQTLR